MPSPENSKALTPLQRRWTSLRSIQENQRLYIYAELARVRGLVPLLMKRRNGGQWTDKERETLMRNLRALSNLSPYLIPLLMPGGIFLLPLLAWWLDRRRQSREERGED